MKAARTTRVQAGYVCQLCQLNPFYLLARSQRTPRVQRTFEPAKKRARSFQEAGLLSRRWLQTSSQLAPSKSRKQRNSLDLNTSLKRIDDESRKIVKSVTVPDETAILEVLVKSQELANVIVFGQVESPAAKEERAGQDGNSTSSLLDLDEAESSGSARFSSSAELPIAIRQKTSYAISSTIYDLVRDPKVFITSGILEHYVRIQLLLGKPQYLPAIFDLYVKKPIPTPGSSPITYSKPWTRSPKNAIPMKLSDAALEAAIAKKDLPLTLAIIETTVATPAFRVNKVLHRATIPLAAFMTLPFAAYTAADWFSNYQNTMDENMAKGIAITGGLAYIGTISTVGFVALTSYNDQMERVTWQPGFRLRDRWLREEERLYFDRVAMAWGFKEKWRRGEEQGEEWEALREFLGMRMMILDKSSLLEGME